MIHKTCRNMVELSAGHLFLCWSQRFSHHLRVARHTVSQTKPFQSSNLHCPTPNVLLMDLRRHHGIHQPRYQRTGLLRKKSIPPLRRQKKGGFHFPEIHQLKFKLKLMKPRKWEAYFLDANIRFFLNRLPNVVWKIGSIQYIVLMENCGNE